MGMIEDALREYASFEDRVADPSTPAAGTGLIYFKDGKIHSIDDAGTVVEYGAAVGGGGEFTEQVTAKVNGGNLTTTSPTFVDATGLTATLTTAAVRCLVIFSGVAGISATGQVCFDLVIDGTRIGAANAHGLMFMGANSSSQFFNVSFTHLTDVLSAGSHTIKLQWRTTTGTATLFANTTVAPAILTVLETSMAS